MVLEQTINRSMNNNSYHFKISRHTENNFQIVKNFKTWSLEQCKLKKQNETQKM